MEPPDHRHTVTSQSSTELTIFNKKPGSCPVNPWSSSGVSSSFNGQSFSLNARIGSTSTIFIEALTHRYKFSIAVDQPKQSSTLDSRHHTRNHQNVGQWRCNAHLHPCSQWMLRYSVKNSAQTIRTLCCIQPVCHSCLIPASTSGNPVCPRCHAFSAAGSSFHSFNPQTQPTISTLPPNHTALSSVKAIEASKGEFGVYLGNLAR